jgi:hypothetical protein
VNKNPFAWTTDAPHYPVQMMPHQKASKTIYTAEAKRQRETQRVARARSRSGSGRRP